MLYEGRGAKAFRIPRVPVGRYLVVIFDPSEGWPRHHYTWTTFAVTSPSTLPHTGSQSQVLALTALALILMAFGLFCTSREDASGSSPEAS